MTASPPQQWWMPVRSRSSIRQSSSPTSLASVGVARMLMSSASQTVNGSPARSAPTSEATKYPKPWSCARGPRAAPCTPEMRATAPCFARSLTTSSDAAFRKP